jgi:hypothetical protein
MVVTIERNRCFPNFKDDGRSTRLTSQLVIGEKCSPSHPAAESDREPLRRHVYIQTNARPKITFIELKGVKKYGGSPIVALPQYSPEKGPGRGEEFHAVILSPLHSN